MILRTLVLFNAITFASLYAGPAEEAWEAYLAGDFDRVEQLVIEVASAETIDSTQLSGLYFALGCSDAILGRDSAAVTSFEIALSLDPSIDLSPVDLPPPVWKVYKPVRDRILQRRSEKVDRQSTLTDSSRRADLPYEEHAEIPTRIDTAFIVKPVYRASSATLKSLVFPGWGHITEGKRKGYVFAGIEAVAVTGLIISALDANRARDDYLKARTPVEIADRYDSYNRSYQLTWGLAVIVAATYLIAQVDFFNSQPPCPISLSLHDQKRYAAMPVNMQSLMLTIALRL